ncbi:protein transporter [Ceraceosorus guamensis]|uniref:Mitochondrial import inner membrane translocase subunit TIM16 n=1 Tax=Ceraceosorus guamensis TaxID=1522189 RepID=A0A316W2H6_9BASI|nr:protein transporter [Ceraceosorus guamensis]PWN43970.1 protein transporter [Ceraceosorus guamensis]
MSLPRLLAQFLFLGTQIVGKAFAEAGRQAARNARAAPVEAGAAGASTGNSARDALTRTHRMTLDEARMILNLDAKQVASGGEEIAQELEKRYTQLFNTNAPPAPKGKSGGGQGSFYVQSKIVRARERIEAEWAEILKKGKENAEGGNGNGAAGGNGASDAGQTNR